MILFTTDIVVIVSISTTDYNYAKLTELTQEGRYDTLYGAVQYLCNVVDLSRKEDLKFALRRKVVAEALHALDAQGFIITSVVQGWASMGSRRTAIAASIEHFAEKLWGAGPKADLFCLLEEHSFGDDDDYNEMETAERDLRKLCRRLEAVWSRM